MEMGGRPAFAIAMDRSEQIKEIIADEIRALNEKRAVASEDEEYKIHGAVCWLMMISGRPEAITLEKLREEYEYQKERSKKSEFKNRALDLAARNRAVKICHAAISLGKRIRQLDKVT